MTIAPHQPDKLKRLELRARQVVEGFLTGRHASPFHGSAVEFASHRAYAPGDELRHLDWKVWWKTQRLYVKQHEDQTHLPCTLVVDASRSMRYGSGSVDEGEGLLRASPSAPPSRDPASNVSGNRDSKFEHAAILAASLAFVLRQQQDAVGLAILDDGQARITPPSTHPRQFEQIVRTLSETDPTARANLCPALRQLATGLRRRGLVVLVSDLFVDPDELAVALRDLRVRGQETLVFQILHGDELTFPFEGVTLFQAAERDASLEADPAALRRAYLRELEQFLQRVRTTCSLSGADYHLIDMRQPLEAALAHYLHLRQRAPRAGGRGGRLS